MPEYVQQWNISSFTEPSKQYKVSLDEDGNFSCSCPHHVYRKAECKHIKVAKQRQEDEIWASALNRIAESKRQLDEMYKPEGLSIAPTHRCYKCDTPIPKETAKSNKGLCNACTEGWHIEPTGRKVRL